MSATAAVANPNVVIKFLKPWIGNQRMFYSQFALNLEKKIPFFATINNVTFAAPTFKWLLAIVPLSQAIAGNPTVEKLDMKQSASLTFTGGVWAWYSLLITPQNAGSRTLCAVNLALFCANGYNVVRKYKYEKAQKALTAAA